MQKYCKPSNYKSFVHFVNTSKILYTIQTDLAEKTYDESAVEWYNILAQLQTDEYARVFILHNETDVTKIVEKLEQFEKQEISLIFDNTLKKNEIKIILEN